MYLAGSELLEYVASGGGEPANIRRFKREFTDNRSMIQGVQGYSWKCPLPKKYGYYKSKSGRD